MDLKEIKELIALMRKNDLSEFKLEQEGFKITLRRGNDFQPTITNTGTPPVVLPSTGSTAGSANSGLPAVPAETLREITSPMVGTFYGSASPESPPYVSVGQEVTEDTVVCIIEAMKVMNEIKPEIRGIVVEAVAETGKPVQYGQVLFRVR